MGQPCEFQVADHPLTLNLAPGDNHRETRSEACREGGGGGAGRDGRALLGPVVRECVWQNGRHARARPARAARGPEPAAARIKQKAARIRSPRGARRRGLGSGGGRAEGAHRGCIRIPPPGAGVRPREESTLLYVLSHTTPHTNLHINKAKDA
jgi:hypothetical protein